MKKHTSLRFFVMISILGACFMLTSIPTVQAQSGASDDGSGWWCPWCGRGSDDGWSSDDDRRGGWGRHRWGQGGRGGGRHMGPGGRGHMGPGYGHMGPGSGSMHRFRGYGARQSSEPLTKEEAESLLKHYVRSTENPNLKLGKVTDEKEHYVGEITTKDGSLVDKIRVDKRTGWMKSVY